METLISTNTIKFLPASGFDRKISSFFSYLSYEKKFHFRLADECNLNAMICYHIYKGICNTFRIKILSYNF